MKTKINFYAVAIFNVDGTFLNFYADKRFRSFKKAEKEMKKLEQKELDKIFTIIEATKEEDLIAFKEENVNSQEVIKDIIASVIST